MTRLDELPLGRTAVVEELLTRGPQRRRLLDLGLVPGAEVRAEMTSPLGDPTAYRVLGTLVVLRRAQAREIGLVDRRGEVGADD